MNIRYDMFIFSKTEDIMTLVNKTILYQFMIIFVQFLSANFGQKISEKLCIFALFWLIFGKIQLVPKENLVEFVTLEMFKCIHVK